MPKLPANHVHLVVLPTDTMARGGEWNTHPPPPARCRLILLGRGYHPRYRMPDQQELCRLGPVPPGYMHSHAMGLSNPELLVAGRKPLEGIATRLIPSRADYPRCRLSVTSARLDCGVLLSSRQQTAQEKEIMQAVSKCTQVRAKVEYTISR